MSKACRYCKFYDLQAVQSKAGAALRDRAARCKWEWPPTPMPASVPKHERRLPQPTYMEPYQGGDCETFERA